MMHRDPFLGQCGPELISRRQRAHAEALAYRAFVGVEMTVGDLERLLLRTMYGGRKGRSAKRRLLVLAKEVG